MEVRSTACTQECGDRNDPARNYGLEFPYRDGWRSARMRASVGGWVLNKDIKP